MEKQMNIPQLRFPEFEGQWEKKKLGKILKIGSGRDYKHLSSGDVPVFGTGGLMTMVDQYLYEGETVCIGRKGTIDKPMYFIGKIWTVDTLFYTHSFIDAIPKFVYALFQRVNWKQHNEAGGVPSLSKSTIEQIVLNLPTVSEQTKIASFLTAVDEKIQSLKKKKSLLEDYKKGISQKLFSQELRFKDEEGKDFPDWEVKKLGELGETYGGLSGKTKDDFGKGKPYVQYKQIFDDSKIDISRFELVDISVKEKQNKAKFGDVFFTVSSETPNEIGMSSVLLDYIDELYLNSFCFGYRANSLEILSPYFSKYLFRSEIFRNEIIKLAQGSTRYNMSKLQLMKIAINLPYLPEQTKIANFLSAVDDKIKYTDVQIKKMEVWKKGLLQKMFV
ncbi:restriction endonuclease subunit S [Pedobacter changchengzhani]|uniref:Restriction endonuclease subunit S n=1 Tax=Pedobacter changchengzhani TaxID=2529274 RepID=A0A4R5MLB9_9SPHI|nr:restriction endonuclease subunit S [Pedobacter changchengzhani]TDG35889.1 restriction endonuclease subunit S [Pedobacter changchengzhani]